MSRRGWLLLGALGLIWGTPYLFIKVAVGQVSPATVVFARTAIGALLLLPFALRAGGLRPLRGHWGGVVAFAVLEIVGPWFWLSNAERTLNPLVAVTLGAVVLDEPVTWGLLLATVLILAGSAAAARRQPAAATASAVPGDPEPSAEPDVPVTGLVPGEVVAGDVEPDAFAR